MLRIMNNWEMRNDWVAEHSWQRCQGGTPEDLGIRITVKILQPPVAPALQGVRRMLQCGLITSPSHSGPLLSVQRKLRVGAVKCRSWNNERPVLAFPRYHMMDIRIFSELFPGEGTLARIPLAFLLETASISPLCERMWTPHSFMPHLTIPALWIQLSLQCPFLGKGEKR